MCKSLRCLGIVLVLTLIGCTGAAPKPTEPTSIPSEPFELTILHTNNVMGAIEPCG